MDWKAVVQRAFAAERGVPSVCDSGGGGEELQQERRRARYAFRFSVKTEKNMVPDLLTTDCMFIILYLLKRINARRSVSSVLIRNKPT